MLGLKHLKFMLQRVGEADTEEDVQAYIAARKSRFPTAARVEVCLRSYVWSWQSSKDLSH